MRGRVGVLVVVVGLFAAGLAAGAIQAGPTSPPTTTDVTTTATTTQQTTTAVPVSTETLPATTTPTTTANTTTATSPAVATALAATPAPAGCLVVAAFAVLEPGRRRPLVLGQPADATRPQGVAARRVGYPGDGSVLTASSIDLRTAGCSSGRADVRSVSLFGGVITARRVELGIHRGVAGAGVGIAGLAVEGKTVALRPGVAARVEDWGSVVALARPDHSQAGTLAVHLGKAHAGLPAGTVLLVSFAKLTHPKPGAQRNRHAGKAPSAGHRQKGARTHGHAKARKRHHRRGRKHHLGDDPLTVTPPLGVNNYLFPVAGESSYGDSYGGYRGDVPGNWHHGDDIFAAIGTPVVAVADGTLNRVGWEHLGGWRLWVRDGMRNEFYYAHLSGYSPLALHSKRVHAGDVIGFIGNTGDAFTTPPHLHFEIHPHQLLQLGYNGAVNPTRYLDAWQHRTASRVPKPAHPPFPPGTLRAETSFVWRQLLAARGLISHAPRPSERPHIRIPHFDTSSEPRRVAAAAAPLIRHASGAPLVDVLAGLIAPIVAFGLTLSFRLRRKSP